MLGQYFITCNSSLFHLIVLYELYNYQSLELGRRLYNALIRQDFIEKIPRDS